MSDLCWKCRKYYKGSATLYQAILYQPDSHCHHEPKEEPKCICENRSTIIEYFVWHGSEKSQNRSIKFCPECGRKL